MSFDPRRYLIKLKGRDYLPVAARLIWLNDHTDRYRIETQFLKLEETYAVVQATVSLLDHTGATTRSANALKREDLAHFVDFLEKSETGAIGRALGMLGFGTQFAPEFDEIEGKVEARFVDSPRITNVFMQTKNNADVSHSESTVFIPENLPLLSGESQISLSIQQSNRSELAAAGLKPASSFGPPTNKHKPVFEDKIEAIKMPFTQVVMDIDDGFEEYDHSAVADEDLFSETKVRRLLTIGEKLFSLKGDVLEARLHEAASKILIKSIGDLNALHWKDGNKIMQALEDQAIKRGVWDAPKK